MCTSPKHDVGLSLWPVSLKVSGCCSNLKENVSNNLKYSYLIYWAFMFLPQLGCYGLRRNLRQDCISYLIWITIRKIDCSCRYIIFLNQCICLAQHWTLYIACWRLSHIWYKKSELKKNKTPWFLVKNSMKWSDVKRKRPRPVLNDVGLLKSLA